MKTYQLILIIFLFFIPKSLLYGQSIYDYPIKPGTEEWKHLKNHDEMIMVCQLPDSILKAISSYDLIETCLNYPLLGDIMAFNFVQDGIDALKTNFNGINELLRRNDCAKLLIDKYRKSYPSKFNKDWSLIEKGEYSFKIMVIELLLGQDEVLIKINESQKKDLVKLLLIKKEEKSDPEVYDLLSHMTICYAISKIILSENLTISLTTHESIAEIERFAMRGNLDNTRLISSIITLANKFIK